MPWSRCSGLADRLNKDKFSSSKVFSVGEDVDKEEDADEAKDGDSHRHCHGVDRRPAPTLRQQLGVRDLRGQLRGQHQGHHPCRARVAQVLVRVPAGSYNKEIGVR